MEKLELPFINKKKFRLGTSMDVAMDNPDCFGGASIDFNSNSTIDCKAGRPEPSRTWCTNCLLARRNILIGISYLVQEEYISKADALKFNLDYLSKKGEGT